MIFVNIHGDYFDSFRSLEVIALSIRSSRRNIYEGIQDKWNIFFVFGFISNAMPEVFLLIPLFIRDFWFVDHMNPKPEWRFKKTFETNMFFIVWIYN